MKKLYVKFLLMNTLATFLLALCIIKVMITGLIFLFMLAFLGYLIFAAMLFKKQATRIKDREKKNDIV